MQTLNLLQKVSLTLITLNLSLTGGKAIAGSFSGSTFDPGKIDWAIAGFVGSDGLGADCLTEVPLNLTLYRLCDSPTKRSFWDDIIG